MLICFHRQFHVSFCFELFKQATGSCIENLSTVLTLNWHQKDSDVWHEKQAQLFNNGPKDCHASWTKLSSQDRFGTSIFSHRQKFTAWLEILPQTGSTVIHAHLERTVHDTHEIHAHEMWIVMKYTSITAIIVIFYVLIYINDNICICYIMLYI
jgi:hypothetical protein